MSFCKEKLAVIIFVLFHFADSASILEDQCAAINGKIAYQTWANISSFQQCQVLRVKTKNRFTYKDDEHFTCFNTTTNEFSAVCMAFNFFNDSFNLIENNTLRWGVDWTQDAIDNIYKNWCNEKYNITHIGGTCFTLSLSLLTINGEDPFCAGMVIQNASTFGPNINRICTPSYHCFCKKLFLYEDNQVDCGFGFFTIADEMQYLKPICIGGNQSTIPFDVDGKNLIKKSEFIEVDESLHPDVLYFILRTTAVGKILDYSYLTNELGTNTTFLRYRVLLTPDLIDDGFIRFTANSTIKLDDLIIRTVDGKIRVSVGDHIRFLRSDYTNLTLQDQCHLGDCPKCESKLEYAYCKMDNFGWVRISIIALFGCTFLCVSPWIIAIVCCSVRVMKCWICTPWKYIRATYKKLRRVAKKTGRKMDKTVSDWENPEDEDFELEEGSTMKDSIQGKRLTSERGLVSGLTQDQLALVKVEISMMSDKEAKQAVSILRQNLLEKGDLSKVEMYKLKCLEEKLDKSVGYSIPSPKTQRMFVFFLLFAFGLKGAYGQCTAKALSESNVKSCVKFNSTHDSCTFLPRVTAALSGIGSIYCEDIISNKSEPIDQIQISFETFTARSTLTTAYYTTDYDVLEYSSRHCFLTKCCNYGSYHGCSSWLARKDSEPNPCGLIPDDMYSYPGITGCTPGQGCAANDCVSCANTCGYWRWALKPKNAIATVSTAGLITYEARIQIVSDKLGAPIEITTSNPSFENEQLSVSIVGVFIDFQLNLDGHFVSTERGMYFADSSPSNSPQIGLPGDIQAGDPTWFQDKAKNNLPIMAKDLIEVGLSGHSIEFTSGQSGLQILYANGGDRLLPVRINSIPWEYNATTNVVEGLIDRQLNAIVQINFKTPVQFYEEVDDVCPSATFVSMTGCYDCSAGANILITAKSTCFPGSCVVVSKDTRAFLMNNQISLTNKVTSFNLTMVTNLKTVNLVLSVHCNGGTTDFDITGTLNSDVDIYNNGGNTTYNFGHDGSGKSQFDFANWLGDLLNLSSHWASIIIMIVSSILGIAVVIVIFYIIIKVVRSGRITTVNANISAVDIAKKVTGAEFMSSQVKKLKPSKSKPYEQLEMTDM